ncbi:MAG: hypothetical protein HY365_01520 [Candidatus Aenigmarchaeota archaeon]|nr:hypothetical protein [Candidatus Aenigmarchaeota archaeon]
MKGVEQVVSQLLLTAVLIAVVTSVTAVGLPLLDKTRDASTIENSKTFMLNLESAIKDVANHGGRVRIPVTVDADVLFDEAAQRVDLEFLSSGTVFDSESAIPLGRNDCGATQGVWQDNSPLTLCVLSTCVDTGVECRKYAITYTLEPVELKIGGTLESRKVVLESAGNQLGSKGSTIIIEKTGDDTSGNEKKTLMSFAIDS